MITRFRIEDDNIDRLRRKYGAGLHWVVGDVHGETRTLQALMEKIRFYPKHDRVYFVGDYNAGGNPHELMRYIAAYYAEDDEPGFHLIRGNHERELSPLYALENMPDLLAIRGKVMNYMIVHAGMVRSALDLICSDMASEPDRCYFAYRLSEECACYDAPLRQITWSRRGLYSQHSRWKNWPDEYTLYHNRACIIHGHTPYCFFSENMHSFYGDKSLFWENQRIWFSEDLQSFDIDSNIKGVWQNGESHRGLSCVCLEAIEEIASGNASHLTTDAVMRADNFVFSADYVRGNSGSETGKIEAMLAARPAMKTFRLNEEGVPYLSEV